jgi:hypothetical protein
LVGLNPLKLNLKRGEVINVEKLYVEIENVESFMFQTDVLRGLDLRVHSSNLIEVSYDERKIVFEDCIEHLVDEVNLLSGGKSIIYFTSFYQIDTIKKVKYNNLSKISDLVITPWS